MKRYGLRLALANALIVVSAATLAALLIGWIVPGSVTASRWLLPVLAALVSCVALAFALVESIAVFRSWKKEKPEEPTPPLPPEI